MRRTLRLAVLFVALAVPGAARATVPEFDAWNEGIYVFDGGDVCFSIDVDEDDKATCTAIRDTGYGGSATDILNFTLQAYFNDTLGGDDVDTLIIMSDFDQQLGDALAYYAPLCNSIGGTGRGGTPCGAQELSGIINMNSSDKFPPDYTGGGFFDTLGQEVEHQLAAFLQMPDADLLGRSGSHWSFFFHTEGSVMEGNKWRDEGNGTFTSVDPDGGFHAIDQYLWGFLPPEEVPPLFVIEPAPWFGIEDGPYPINPATLRGINAPACSVDAECPPDGPFARVCARQPCEVDVDCEDGSTCVEGNFGMECDDGDGATDDGTCEYELTSWMGPRSGTVVRGTRHDFTIDDIIAYNGARSPSFFTAPKTTREWFVFFTRPGEQTPEASNCVEGRFDRVVRMRREWSKYFYEQTDFRGRVLTNESLVDDLPLWEWGLVSEGYQGGTLPEQDALERWTSGGSVSAPLKVLSRDPISCATDVDCDEGQRCIRRACQGTDRYLHVETNGGDAYIESPFMRFHAADYNTARITMNANQGGTSGRLEWSTDGASGFSEDRSVSFAVSGNGVRRIHVGLLLEEDGWAGDITGLRLYPGDDAGSFDIDRVELLHVDHQRYCVGPEDGSCGECPVGTQCRGGSCKPPLPCALQQCVLPESTTPCVTPCEEGWACVDGSCQIPKACDEACECDDDAATCEARDVCPSGWSCDSVVPDRDGDGFLDEDDNCRDLPNPEQIDADRDGVGDDCQDLDGDGVVNASDNCPDVTNSRQGDEDSDGVGDVCDDDFEYDVGCTCRTLAPKATSRAVPVHVDVLVLVLVLVFARPRRTS